MTERETKNLISPATTPGSIHNDHYFLVPRSSSFPPAKKTSWYKKFPPPYALLTASFLQVVVFIISDKEIEASLRFEPNNKEQSWRFLTYMLLHDSWFHIALNIFIQCLFAAALEKSQGHLRVGILYMCGGAIGAFGASCVRPDLVIGASAGVYALLTSHISNVILNFKTIKYKLYRCVSVLIIVSSDVFYNLGHFYYSGHPIISWGAHAVGAISGFILGLCLYKTTDEEHKKKTGHLFCAGILMLIMLVTFLIIITMQIERCTPPESINIKYVYNC